MKPKNRLVQERENFPLDVSKLTEFLFGGPSEYKIRQEALDYVLNKTEFLKEFYGFQDLSRAEKRKLAFKNLVTITNIHKDIKDPKLLRHVMSIIVGTQTGVLSRHGLSVYFFGGGIIGQGTQEQIDYYLPRLENLEITGCYCITELGTGSYIKAFQTTATFLHETDEFEIHTPTLTATKWWVGNAAQTATHGIVFARLIVKGQDHGVHNFVVQLRDEDFSLCKGVRIGDVGPKRGSDSTDNGWLSFDHVRIPRTQMLMKWDQVDRDGNFTSTALPQVAYGALIVGRVYISMGVVDAVKKAVTIASRYSIVRDQYSMEGKCLLDYTTQQERVIGALCSAYAFDIATKQLLRYFDKVDAELKEKDTSHLKELHNNSAAMKGFVALWGSRATNDCILALGGHSFSHLSGLPRLLADTAPSIPYEGDAIVLVQQTASYLVKTVANLMQGKAVNGDSVSYLNKLGTFAEMKCASDPTKKLSLDEIKEAALWLALCLVKEAASELQAETQKRGSVDEAWNACQLKLISASKAHFMYTVINMLQDVLKGELPNALGVTDSEVLPVLTQVVELFALRHVQESLGVFYENNYFPTTRGSLIQHQISDLYASIRPYVARLVDAWDYHDNSLESPLGRFDGDVYEHYFKAVNELPQDIKPEYWKEFLKLRF